MPKIELEIGEAVVVTFAGTDGEITVAFSDHAARVLVGCRSEVAMKLSALGGVAVHADLGDRAGREGVIYHEPCDVLDDEGFKKEIARTGVCLKCKRNATLSGETLCSPCKLSHRKEVGHGG